MTDKQKKAVGVLNTLHRNLSLTFFSDDDYFLLLEFVMEPQITTCNIPFVRDIEPRPLEPYYETHGIEKGIYPNVEITTTDNANKVENERWNPNETLMGESND